MRLADFFRQQPRGMFALDVYRRGVLIESVRRPNLIVNGSKAVMANLIGGTVTNNSITTIGYGTNGTAPVGGNTGLTSPFTKPVDSVTFPAAGQVQFNFSLLTTVKIMEAHGLRVFDVEELKSHGGSLRVYACRVESKSHQQESNVAKVLADEMSLASWVELIFSSKV